MIAHWLVMVPAGVAIAWLAGSHDRMRAYLRAVSVLAPSLGCSDAVAVAQAVSVGRAEEMGS